MKRTELLTKYQPTYPLVQEVDKQLMDTRLALAKEESSPVKEETTDQNPTYAWVNSELAKAKADLSGFQARETALTAIVNVYMAQARQLEQQGILQGDLMRTEKADEANYLLYTKKKEEARIEDALDRTRLLNVSVAQTSAASQFADAVSVGLRPGGLPAGRGGESRRRVRDRLRGPVVPYAFGSDVGIEDPGAGCGSDPQDQLACMRRNGNGNGNGNGQREWPGDVSYDTDRHRQPHHPGARVRPMFLDFFGLREQPFGVTPDPRYLYLGPAHREALASLYYGIEANRGFLSLIARPGMGKTTLLFHLLAKFDHTARTAFLFQTQCSSREFMRFLLAEIGIETESQDFVRMHEQFNRCLVQEARAGKRFIIVIDEAQNLDATVLETVRLLSDFETPQAKLLQIILVGQPGLADKLASPSLVQLRQRITSVSGLSPLTREEIGRFMDHRLQVAGYRGARLFSPEAQELIAQVSEGIPRQINNYCFHALSSGVRDAEESRGREHGARSHPRPRHPPVCFRSGSSPHRHGMSTARIEQRSVPSG